MAKKRPFGYVRKLKSGNFQASYPGPDGARYNAARTFKTETEARRNLKEQEALIRLGQWLSPHESESVKEKSFSFGEFCERHISLQTTRDGTLLRPSTRALYMRLLSSNLSHFATRSLDSITTGEVSDWWALATAKGRMTSAAHAYKLMKATFNRAISEGLVDRNPCNVRGAAKASTGRRIEVPTIQDIQAISKHINPRFKVMVRFAALAGLRFGEMTSLTRKDFTKTMNQNGTESYIVSVDKTVVFVQGEFKLGPPKSKYSIRRIMLSPHLTNELDEHFQDTKCESPHSLVFPAANGTFLRHDVFAKAWSNALKKAEIERNLTPHGLRHFAGSEYALTGANLAELKDWLGDGSTSAVMRYIHATGRSEDLAARMRAL